MGRSGQITVCPSAGLVITRSSSGHCHKTIFHRVTCSIHLIPDRKMEEEKRARRHRKQKRVRERKKKKRTPNWEQERVPSFPFKRNGYILIKPSQKKKKQKQSIKKVRNPRLRQFWSPNGRIGQLKVQVVGRNQVLIVQTPAEAK